jgi:ABC-type uncharacterized transport system permease subunit
MNDSSSAFVTPGSVESPFVGTTYAFGDSPHFSLGTGTICQALRETPERAQALRVNVQRRRWKTFFISGAFTGLAGALLTIHGGGITPGATH